MMMSFCETSFPFSSRSNLFNGPFIIFLTVFQQKRSLNFDKYIPKQFMEAVLHYLPDGFTTEAQNKGKVSTESLHNVESLISITEISPL